MPYNASGVVSYGFPQSADPFTFTYLISGLADDDAVAAAPGKAVAQDVTAASTVKLAGNGDAIFGRVYQAENRAVLGIKTASIQRKFKEKLPAATGHGIIVGDSVVGAGGGLVKRSLDGSSDPLANNTTVVEVGDDYVVVELF